MTLRQVIRPDDGDDVNPHPHDATEISGEATFITVRVDRLLAGTISGKEITVAGGTAGVIKSDNYAAGTDGWAIVGDGSAEFSDVTVRGVIVAGAGSSIGFDDVTDGSNVASLTIGSGGTLESSNFATGSAGWQIDGDGNAEFQTVTARGSITAESGSDIPADFFTAGTIGAEEIILTDSASSIIRSGDYSAGVSGWQITGDGNAEFNDVVIRGDLVSDNYDGTLDLSSGPSTAATAGWFFDTSAGAGQVSGDFFVGSSVQLFDTMAADPDDLWIIDRTSGDNLDISFFDASAVSTTRRVLLGDQGSIQFYDPDGTTVAFEYAGSGADDFRVNKLARFSDGSAASPGIGFVADVNTGIYRASADVLGFSTGGTVRLVIGSASIQPNLKITGTDGSAANPAYGFDNDGDTGFYRVGANTIGVATAGSAAATFEAGGQFRVVDADAATPALSFINDADTGIYRISSNRIGIATAGALRLDVSTAGLFYSGATVWHAGNDGAGSGLDADTVDGSHASAFASSSEGVTNGNSHNHAGGDGGTIAHGALSGTSDTGSHTWAAVYGSSTVLAANTNTDGTRTVRLSTSKAEFKDNIRPWEVSDEEWAQLTTHQYESKLDGGVTLRGFVWDYLPETLRQSQSPDMYALVAALVSRVKRLENA